jgi:hypothetical protein
MLQPSELDTDLPLAVAPVRLLALAAREPDWTHLAAQMALRYGTDLRLTWLNSGKQALLALRESTVDAVLIGELGDSWKVSAERIRDFVLAVQALDGSAALVVLLPVPDDLLQAELHDRDCTVCVSPRMWDSSALPAAVAEALRRRQRGHELQRLSTAHHRRLLREQADAESVLRLQRDVLRTLQGAPAVEVGNWSARYDELLRASILSSPQWLAVAVAELVQDLFAVGCSPPEFLALHAERVQALAAGCAGRTSQQVLSRANLLALEVLAHLGERYRQANRSADAPADVPEIRAVA